MAVIPETIRVAIDDGPTIRKGVARRIEVVPKPPDTEPSIRYIRAVILVFPFIAICDPATLIEPIRISDTFRIGNAQFFQERIARKLSNI